MVECLTTVFLTIVMKIESVDHGVILLEDCGTNPTNKNDHFSTFDHFYVFSSISPLLLM